MKIAIISDIHSNLEALTAVVAHARESGAENFACLGDCVGYGPDPQATLDLIMSLPGLIAVCGNHDRGLFSGMRDSTPEHIKHAIEWTRQCLDDRHLEFLSGLPYSRSEHGATFAHASAWQPADWEYLQMPDQIPSCLDAAENDITFIGHVHIPKVFYEISSGEIRELAPQGGIRIPLAAKSRYVINVGSVGQPRDRNTAACYVLYDSEQRDIIFHRVAYDYYITGEKIRAAGLNRFFAERLTLGR